jgi:hypothetical protein
MMEFVQDTPQTIFMGDVALRTLRLDYVYDLQARRLFRPIEIMCALFGSRGIIMS